MFVVPRTLQSPLHIPETRCPPIPDERMDAIPGAKAARGDTAALGLKVTKVIGGKLIIDEAHLVGMSSQTLPPAYCERFEKLLAKHKTYEMILVNDNTPVPSADAERKRFNTLDYPFWEVFEDDSETPIMQSLAWGVDQRSSNAGQSLEIHKVDPGGGGPPGCCELL